MDTSSMVLLHLCCLTSLMFELVICTGLSNSEILCIPSEHEALLRVKHLLIDPSNRLASWNVSNTDCCNWNGVVCSDVTGHVLQLRLSTSGDVDYSYRAFSGEISPSLLDLKHLSHLDLSGNDFETVQIPSFIFEMTTLTYLNLSSSGLYGVIPQQIGNLSNLLYLDLNINYWGFYFSATGVIPYQIGNLTKLLRLALGNFHTENLHWLSNLSHLQYLYLEDANLSKSFDWLQTLQALPSLMELRLSKCSIPRYNHPSAINFSSLVTLQLSDISSPDHSSVPKWIFGLGKLVSLQLLGDNIQDFFIHDSIQNLTLLENLYLFGNSFSSFMPHWLFGLRRLKFMNIASSNLSGTISDNIGNLTSLVELDLSSNQLEGMIPTSLGLLTSLIRLDLSENKLEGKIPTSLRNLCNLREMYFSHLKLNQQLNEILEILTPHVSQSLTRLIISGSHLSGNLTEKIGLFKNIFVIDLSNNSIHGALPVSFGKLSSLRSLDVSKNQLNGNPFQILSSLYELSDLTIDDNLFQGVVKEDDLVNLESLVYFYASRNNFTLEVDSNWHPRFHLISLVMSSWQLGPNFPSWIESQKDLQYLEISNAGISDSIPAWFPETLRDLWHLNLSHNHIHGEIPLISGEYVDLSSNQFYGKLPIINNYTRTLDLSNNSFSGSMADFLCKKSDYPLIVLNLASNSLSGKIPDCWMMWPKLVYVNLVSNHFVGNLPPSIGSITFLQTLQLHNNSLSGMFPTVLEKTNSLICLDLGENKFTGIIPEWIGESLSQLKILRLRSNRFLGNIPREICDMIFLQDLDLANNNLSEHIPSCFNNLSSMLLSNRSKDSSIHVGGYSRFIGHGVVINSLIWLKGSGGEYRNILGLVTNIDLAGNKLSGEIPIEITKLDGLIYLNLSKNQLSGQIPPSIGNMRSLEIIDLSKNQLSGHIPPTISNLSFLSKFDVSYNHLEGEIPTATQVQTFEASDFVGNNLCGPPLPNCSSHAQIPNEKEGDGHGVNWFLVSMAVGFIVGFWIVVAPLFIFRSWRYAYYRFLDDMWYKMKYCW